MPIEGGGLEKDDIIFGGRFTAGLIEGAEMVCEITGIEESKLWGGV